MPRCPPQTARHRAASAAPQRSRPRPSQRAEQGIVAARKTARESGVSSFKRADPCDGLGYGFADADPQMSTITNWCDCVQAAPKKIGLLSFTVMNFGEGMVAGTPNVTSV